MHKCECATKAVPFPELDFAYSAEEMKARVHEPNECPGDVNVRLYLRKDGSKKWLCSCCCLTSDTKIEEGEQDGKDDESERSGPLWSHQ